MKRELQFARRRSQLKLVDEGKDRMFCNEKKKKKGGASLLVNRHSTPDAT